ncbi:hypothetical protein [Allobranchiibius sp. CTAmp26]|uniref:hypothetical protein n=1 Tax=Allobranchiibius sp. CTAmp26 TaxID=2815214 RepID=UPI001AA1D260|nr:hypothetical protein [Allobranchiibius sp. CTAmp26]MBO1756010.1 hypothetical protein [Allobranchiibius sp. CTAmp26]
MTAVRRVDSASILELHPHRLLLLLAAVLSAVLVQVMIPVAGDVNALEIVLFAVAVALVLLDATGVGANLLTAVTALGWVWAGTRGVDGYTLVVAWALLANHGCLALVAHGHPGAPVGRAVAARWGARIAVVGALTALTWCAALAWSTQRLAPTGVFTVIALLLLVGVLLWLRRELTRTDVDG